MKRTMPIVIPVLYFLVAIVLAHVFAPAGYDVRVNTISELAAQDLANAWIMRAGFVGFGTLMALGLFWTTRGKRRPWWVAAPFVLYALCILLTGIWSTTYPGLELPVSEAAAALHSLFATIAGFALTLCIVLCAVRARTGRERVLHIAAALLVVGLSAGFGAFPAAQGLFQRAMYLASFAWMVGFYLPKEPDPVAGIPPLIRRPLIPSGPETEEDPEAIGVLFASPPP